MKEERKRFRVYMKERNAKRIADEAKNQGVDKVNGKINGVVIEENMVVDDKDDQSGSNLADKHEHKRD